MPILIDGHNLIGQMPNIRLSDSDDEGQLVMQLRRYTTRKRGRHVIVVFDHGVYGHPSNLNGYGIECYFAKSPRDADRELIQRIRKVKRHSEWRVVTSDRAVAGEAQARGITVISSQDFARKLQALNEPKARIHDKHRDKPLSDEEINDWMRIFGIEDAEDDDESNERP